MIVPAKHMIVPRLLLEYTSIRAIRAIRDRYVQPSRRTGETYKSRDCPKAHSQSPLLLWRSYKTYDPAHFLPAGELLLYSFVCAIPGTVLHSLWPCPSSSIEAALRSLQGYIHTRMSGGVRPERCLSVARWRECCSCVFRGIMYHVRYSSNTEIIQK